jgi:hypothetical protein
VEASNLRFGQATADSAPKAEFSTASQYWAIACSNTLQTSKLFSVPIAVDGKAGDIIEVKLDRAIENPDGMRAFGTDSVLIVEGGGKGRLSRISLAGDAG